MRLGITEFIDCAHFLPGHTKCGQLHGHTYRVEVMIEGEQQKGGMVIDFNELKTRTREVLQAYDHRNLNDFMEFPTVENICAALSEKLTARVPFPLTIRVWEGNGKWAEI